MRLVENGEQRTLHGHVARGNPHWLRHRDVATSALAIFQAADAYVSPRWYASKAEGGRVVPTWNYRVVHARGMLRFFDDPERLHALVADLSDVHEAGFDEPWSVEDAPGDYVANQLRGIAGFELSIESLEGKWKLSQNRTDADRESAIQGLRTRRDARADEVAAEMERTR